MVNHQSNNRYKDYSFSVQSYRWLFVFSCATFSKFGILFLLDCCRFSYNKSFMMWKKGFMMCPINYKKNIISCKRKGVSCKVMLIISWLRKLQKNQAFVVSILYKRTKHRWIWIFTDFRRQTNNYKGLRTRKLVGFTSWLS